MGTSRVGVPGPDDDPGWGLAVRGALWALIPGMAVFRMRRRSWPGRLDGLIELRSVFLGFMLSLVGVGVVVAFLAGGDDSRGRADLSGEAGAILVSVVGIVCVLVVRFLRRPLDCRSDASLAASYRTRFFLRLAFAEMCSLVGFVAFFLTENPAMYPLGFVFSLAGFATLAPTAAHLELDQQDLHAAGCARSLVYALRFDGRPRP